MHTSPPNPKEKGLEIAPRKSPRKGSENHQKERTGKTHPSPEEPRWIIVDSSKPCSSSPQSYGWLGAFFTKKSPPYICQFKDQKQTPRILHLTYWSSLTWSIDCIKVIIQTRVPYIPSCLYDYLYAINASCKQTKSKPSLSSSSCSSSQKSKRDMHLIQSHL
jgi:hypothetical protein